MLSSVSVEFVFNASPIALPPISPISLPINEIKQTTVNRLY